MTDYQNRVVEEKRELDAKIAKLAAFISGEVFPTIDVDQALLMRQQLSLMELYSTVLGSRIARFGEGL